jgi:hypothetical protein
VFVERLWRTMKYEHLYLNPADDGQTLKRRISGEGRKAAGFSAGVRLIRWL